MKSKNFKVILSYSWIALLGVIFSYSGFVKLLDSGGFEASLFTLFVPHYLIPILIWLIPALELGLVVLLILNPRYGLMAVLSALILFTVIVTLAVLKGSEVSCGCFGTYEAVNWGFYIRNIILFSISYIVLWNIDKGKMHLSFYKLVGKLK